jgi:hypothetical protein
VADDWIMVRVDRSVHADLERVRRSMLIGELMGLSHLEHDYRDRVSLSQVIGRLIAFRDRHAARVRRSKESRRLRSASANREKGQAGEEVQLPIPGESCTHSPAGSKGDALIN